MNIGDVAKRSGISAKMIRHYESIGLITPPARSAAGYREFDAADLHRLRFVRRARDLGFPAGKIRELLDLWSNQRRGSAKVKALALGHIRELKRQMASLEAMLATLETLTLSCHGDERPECPIIDNLAHLPMEPPEQAARKKGKE